MRPPSEALRRALSEHRERDRIDPVRAQREHAAYAAALQAAGVAVRMLRAEPEQPDACFTWDTVLAFTRVGGGPTVLLVAARPGEVSRRSEVASGLACGRALAPDAGAVASDERGRTSLPVVAVAFLPSAIRPPSRPCAMRANRSSSSSSMSSSVPTADRPAWSLPYRNADGWG